MFATNNTVRGSVLPNFPSLLLFTKLLNPTVTMSTYNKEECEPNTQDLLDLCSESTYVGEVDTQELYALTEPKMTTPAKKSVPNSKEHPSPQEDSVAKTLIGFQTQPSPPTESSNGSSVAKQERSDSPLALLINEQALGNLSKAKDELANVKRSFSAQQKKMKTLTKNFEELKKLHEKLKAQVNQSKQLDKQTKNSLQLKDDLITDLKKQLNEYQVARRTTYTDLKKSNEGLRKQVLALEREKRALEVEVQERELEEDRIAQYDKLFEENEKNLCEVASLKKSMVALQKDKVKLQKEVEHLAKRRDDAIAAYMQHEVRKLELAKDIAEKKRKEAESRRLEQEAKGRNIQTEAQAKILKEGALIDKCTNAALLLKNTTKENKRQEEQERLQMRQEHTLTSIKNAQLKLTQPGPMDRSYSRINGGTFGTSFDDATSLMKVAAERGVTNATAATMKPMQEVVVVDSPTNASNQSVGTNHGNQMNMMLSMLTELTSRFNENKKKTMMLMNSVTKKRSPNTDNSTKKKARTDETDPEKQMRQQTLTQMEYGCDENAFGYDALSQLTESGPETQEIDRLCAEAAVILENNEKNGEEEKETEA